MILFAVHIHHAIGANLFFPTFEILREFLQFTQQKEEKQL
jgi:hypothetical protein